MSEHDPNNADKPAASLAFFFPCPGCGQRLKARTELAGKSVKCPRCGRTLLVPHAPPTPAEGYLDALGRWAPPVLLSVALLATFLLKLRHLDHTAISHWDEVFHALVAQNLLKHPFEPTLVDVPYLPYDHTKWQENHIWLHKPVVPLWQAALAFAILGVNTFALRLPSAILSTGAAWLTYLIGKELLDRRAALIAAVLQALSPFLLTLIQGYQFADHVDVTLIFWVEAGIYFLARGLRTGSWSYFLLAGVAQGLGYLSKSYLAAIVFGIALTAWLLPLCRLARREDCRIDLARLLALVGATIATVAPWVVYCAISYPREFWHEHTLVLQHLSSRIEIWGAPWDRVVFDYLIAIYGVFYTPVLVATVALLGGAVTQRRTGLLLVFAWGLGVIVPHLLATTKTPSATVIGVPAFLLLLGQLISDAWRGHRWPLAALTAILTASVLYPAVIRNPGYGYPGISGGVMRQALWVIWHVAGALGGAVALWVALRLIPDGFWSRYLRACALVFCLGALGWLGYKTGDAAWRVTNRNINDPAAVEVGRFARQELPENAVLLCEERRGDEHLTLMFYAGRTCYPLSLNPDAMARQIRQAGGIPYIVSFQRLSFPAVYRSAPGGPVVYQWQE